MPTTAPTTTPKSIRAHTDQIEQIWAKASPLEREYIAAMHEHYEREFARVKADPDTKSIAATINAIVDQYVDEEKKTAPQALMIKCRRGCAACCRVHVSITLPEAHLLLAWAEDQGIAVDWARVERQAQAGLAGWHKQPEADRACVFLGEGGDCRVYEHRPTACRKYFVVSDPAYCDTSTREQVVQFVSPHAEVVASAALATFEYRSMPVMLMKAREAARKEHP